MKNEAFTVIADLVQRGELRYAQPSFEAADHVYVTDEGAQKLKALGLKVDALQTMNQYWVARHNDVDCSGFNNSVSLARGDRPRDCLMGAVGDFDTLNRALEGIQRLAPAKPVNQVQAAADRELMMQAQATVCGALKRWAKS